MVEKRILIIGGFGFLGRNLNAVLGKSDQYEIYNISRRNGYDLNDVARICEYVELLRPDVIIFAAAHVGSIGYVSKYAANVALDNTELYLNLYKLIPCLEKKPLIINPISNCSYPGDIDVQVEDLWWEGEVHESVIAYGMPKKNGYVLAEAFRKQYGINTLNLIMPNSYGENDYVDEERTHAMNGIIMRMLKSMKNNDKEFVVWGTGSPIREWLYMPDMGRLVKYILDNNIVELPSPINVGQEYGISIKDTVLMVKEILDYDVEIKFDLTKQDGAPKKVLSSKLFRQYFPDFEFTDYKTGIGNTIDYYMKKI